MTRDGTGLHNAGEIRGIKRILYRRIFMALLHQHKMEEEDILNTLDQKHFIEIGERTITITMMVNKYGQWKG